MAYVVNDVVKLEDWDKSLWVQLKPAQKGGKGHFIAAGHMFNGKLVLFNERAAFIWHSDDVLWGIKDFANWVKDNVDEEFPMSWPDNADIIAETGIYEVDEEVLEKWGLAGLGDEIVARLKDLEPYSVVKVQNMDGTETYETV